MSKTRSRLSGDIGKTIVKNVLIYDYIVGCQPNAHN